MFFYTLNLNAKSEVSRICFTEWMNRVKFWEIKYLSISAFTVSDKGREKEIQLWKGKSNVNSTSLAVVSLLLTLLIISLNTILLRYFFRSKIMVIRSTLSHLPCGFSVLCVFFSLQSRAVSLYTEIWTVNLCLQGTAVFYFYEMT